MAVSARALRRAQGERVVAFVEGPLMLSLSKHTRDNRYLFSAAIDVPKP